MVAGASSVATAALIISGVSPSRRGQSQSAPAATSIVTHSTWPAVTARCRAQSPSSLRSPSFAERRSRCLTALVLPALDACMSGVQRSRSTALISLWGCAVASVDSLTASSPDVAAAIIAQAVLSAPLKFAAKLSKFSGGKACS